MDQLREAPEDPVGLTEDTAAMQRTAANARYADVRTSTFGKERLTAIKTCFGTTPW